MSPATAKLLKWLLFGVLVSMLPIGGAAVVLFVFGKPIIVSELLGNGDLLVVTCAACAVAMGEVVESEKMTKAQKLGLGFCALLIVLGTCLLFGAEATLRASNRADYENGLGRLAVLSGIAFVLGLGFGGAAVWASEATN
jgi:hypothetical protein